MLSDIVQQNFVINFIAKYNQHVHNMFSYEDVSSAVNLAAETAYKIV
jgi:hypothetical protein